MNRPTLPWATGVADRPLQWLDTLEAGIQAHIAVMQTKRDELAAQVVLAEVAGDMEAVKLSAGLNKAYTAALHMGKSILRAPPMGSSPST